MSLASRRRALLMGQKNKASDVLYNLENHVVQTGDSIDTGIAPFVADLDVTIMFDFNQTYYEGASGAVGSTSKYMVTTTSGNSKFCLGKYGKGDANVRRWWMTVDWSSIANTENGAVRKRIIVTHQRNSGTITIHIKTGTNAKQTMDVSGSFTASSLNLKFGSSTSNPGSLCAGTILIARIYNRILEQSEIDAFFA